MQVRPRPLMLAALCAACACPAAHAADEGIVTDRPDFVESSDTVGKGRVQLETSIAFDRDKSGGITTRTRSTPTLLRLGFADDLEFRVETDGALNQRVSDSSGSTRTRGWSDTALGVKWHWMDGDEAGSRPSMAWLLHFDGPTGSRDFKGQGWRPSLRLTAEWDLPKDWSMGVMGGFYREHNDVGRSYTGGILAVTVGMPIRESLRGFVEVAGQELASQRNGGKVVTFDAGLAWQLAREMQLDTALQAGISKAAPDFAWAVGISLKF